jgi:hypothetical protein
MRDDVESSSQSHQLLAGTVTLGSAVLTAGYIAWSLRGAQLVTTFLSTLPAWSNLDPLPLVSDGRRIARDGDGESLQDIAARGVSHSVAPEEAVA